jgi:phosphate-selective porin OprO/OprP
MRNPSFRRTAPALLALAVILPEVRAAEADELQLLREQIHHLEQKLLVLERKQEIKDEAEATAAPATPKITVNDKGVTLASADAANSLRLRGLVQLDHRAFFNDGGATAGLNNNGFVLRRARLATEGVFAKNYTFQLVTEFGGSATTILDANLGINVRPALQFKVGKFKAPVGLEQLQSDTWTFFNERSIASNLVPNRDLGITAGGDLRNGKLNYTVGVLNGVADGASTTNADFDNEKDLVARVMVSPFKDSAGSALQELSVGVGASYGREKGTAGRTGGYRTDGQQAFFSYLGTTITDGPNWRVSPQFDYRHGSFGLLGEYTVSAVNVRTGATGPKSELRNKSWQIAAGYVLTGENSSYNGVVPATNFDLSKGSWGAFEVTARYANLKVDEDAFPLYATVASNASEASSFGIGVNWYLSKAVAFKLDYYHTDFGFPPGASAVSTNAALRHDEQILITRFQIAF